MTKIHCKRLLCIVVSLLMIVSMLPTGLIAEEVCEHSYVESILKAPTCTTTGVGKYVCSECGDTYYATIAATSHTMPEEGVVTVEPTCTEDGSVTYTCTACENEVTEAISATGHSYISDVTDATCTSPALITEVCEVCGAVNPDAEAIAVGEANGHTWDEGDLVEASCTEAEHVVYTCTVCGETYTEETGLAEATGHTAGEAVVENEVAVTCQADGSYDSVVYCTVCGAELSRETVTVASTGEEHDYEVNVLKAATCTINGVQKNVCTICGASNYTVIPASHTLGEGEVTTEATCTEDGVMTYTCSECGETVTEAIPATGHDYVEVVDVEPTCGEAGTAHQYCLNCGDKTETYEVAATGEHTYVENVTDATCTEPAKAGYFCEVCKAEDPDHPATEVREALGHTTGDTEITDPTCTENAKATTYCSVCGEVIEEVDLGEIDDSYKATGHTAVVDEAVAATCSLTGLTEGSHCSVCGEVLVAQEEVPVDEDAHVYETQVIKEATCTTTGVGKLVCSECGTTNGYVVIPVQHNFDYTTEYVSEDNSYVYVVCAECGEQEIIDYTDLHEHTTEVQNAKEATCTEDGYTGDTVCTVCGETVESGEVVPATGHTPAEEVVNAKDATCTEDGYTGDTVCSECGEVIAEGEVIPATGHSEGVLQLIDGVWYVVCPDCGEILS